MESGPVDRTGACLSRAQKFFRYVWRINAILILIAAAGAAFGVVFFVVTQVSDSIGQRKTEAAAPPVVGTAASKELRLGGFTRIEGTTIYRASLSTRDGRGKYSSSGDSSEVRNILYLNLETGNARWLLPSDSENIAFNEDVAAPSKNGETAPPLGVVVLVKPVPSGSEAVPGRLLLLDIAAEHVNQVAANVRDVHGVTLMPSGDIAIFFERDRKYQLATFDRASLRKLSERTINVPDLH
jgi:hypothetical protein